MARKGKIDFFSRYCCCCCWYWCLLLNHYYSQLNEMLTRTRLLHTNILTMNKILYFSASRKFSNICIQCIIWWTLFVSFISLFFFLFSSLVRNLNSHGQNMNETLNLAYKCLYRLDKKNLRLKLI